jgi:hypothetical protein
MAGHRRATPRFGCRLQTQKHAAHEKPKQSKLNIIHLQKLIHLDNQFSPNLIFENFFDRFSVRL